MHGKSGDTQLSNKKNRRAIAQMGKKIFQFYYRSVSFAPTVDEILLLQADLVGGGGGVKKLISIHPSDEITCRNYLQGSEKKYRHDEVINSNMELGVGVGIVDWFFR